ncbi:MAG: hypothetical protein ABI615_02100 [Chthoniobacterales bacterium]
MIRVIAITQFVFLAMGAFTLSVIVKASTYPDASAQRLPAISVFLAHYGAWLLLIPVLWMAFATICQSTEKGPFTAKFAQGTGIILSAAILVIYTYAIFRP